MIKIKLKEAGWNEENTLVEECLKHNFYEVFSLAPAEFSNWLSGEEILNKVEEEAEEEPGVNELNFEAGYSERNVESYKTKISEREWEINPAHNLIQKKLYTYLADKYGEENVGTEIDSGIGTLIDVVLKEERNKYIFFEIKTSKNVRTAIREALPQLLEYAYWPNEEKAEKLIIVTIKNITNQAKTYMQSLRDKFNIPIYYAKFDLTNETLEEEF